MRVGVTAASGKLAQKLIPELIALVGADNVVGIARDPDKTSVPGVEMRKGDYEIGKDWLAAVAGLDTVILVSAPTDPEGKTDRVQMHRNVIQGARSVSVGKLIYTSVIGNGKEKGTLYEPVAAVNRQTEKELEDSGLEWAIARNGLYLEFDIAHIVNATNSGGVFRNNGGDGRCGYITRDEIAVATAQLAVNDQHNGKIYNLVGECHTQAELVQMVNEVYGIKGRYEPISDQECFTKLEPVRGKIVANMLTGCYQCIRNGAFAVESDFEAACGRPIKPVLQQIAEIKSAEAQAV